jgi:hypothetical protein
MVTKESPLKQFFRPEEVELLVCGSKVWHDEFSLCLETYHHEQSTLEVLVVYHQCCTMQISITVYMNMLFLIVCHVTHIVRWLILSMHGLSKFKYVSGLLITSKCVLPANTEM